MICSKTPKHKEDECSTGEFIKPCSIQRKTEWLSNWTTFCIFAKWIKKEPLFLQRLF